MIILDYQDRRPIYEQVVEKIQLLIVRAGTQQSASVSAQAGDGALD